MGGVFMPSQSTHEKHNRGNTYIPSCTSWISQRNVSCYFEYRTRNTNFAYIFSPWNWEGLSRGWKDIFLWLLNGLTMIDLINCVRGSSSVLTKTLLAYILPVQTEQKRNVCYIACTFQIWMKLTSKLCWTYKYTIHAHVYQQIYTKNPL